jgi:lysozyme
MNKEAIRAYIKANEGFRAFIYDDKTGKPLKPGDTLQGSAAIGYGTDLIKGGIKQVEAEILLADRVEERIAAITDEIPWWVGRPDDAIKALVDVSYQCGVAGLLGFKKMLACLHAGDYVGAARELMDSDLGRDYPERTGRNAALLKNCAFPNGASANA